MTKNEALPILRMLKDSLPTVGSFRSRWFAYWNATQRRTTQQREDMVLYWSTLSTTQKDEVGPRIARQMKSPLEERE